MVKSIFFLGALAASFFELARAGYNAECNNNIITYHGNGGAPKTQSLKYYCTNEKSYADVFIETFVSHRDSNGHPVFSNDEDSCTVDGNCKAIGSDVKYCQSIGKTVLISLGGQGASISLKSASDAHDFAQKIWDAYLGGSGKRPFGSDVVFNGIDLDIEDTNQLHWGEFTTKIRSLFATDSSRKYLIHSAPQPEPVESPDQTTPDFIKNAWVDIAFIQFYNNPGYDGPDTLSMYSWWDSWAQGTEKLGHNSKNPNVKLIYGLPGSKQKGDADNGYQTFSQVKTQVKNIKAKYPKHFGGGGTWDDAWSYENVQNGVNFLKHFKKVLGTCSATKNSTSTSTLTSTSTNTSTKTSTNTSTKTSTNTSTKTSTKTASHTTSTPTTSHSCPNQGSVCPSGDPCCSQYGYCGSTSDFCGKGCDPAASFNGQCVAGASIHQNLAASYGQWNSSSISPDTFFYDRSTLTTNNNSNFLIIAKGLKTAKGASGAFEIKIVSGGNLIGKNWTLVLPSSSGVVSTDRGVITRSGQSITIVSVPSQEKTATVKIILIVQTHGNVKKINLSRAKFITQ